MGRTMGRGSALARRVLERRQARRAVREAARVARDASRAAHALAADAERVRREAEAMRERLTPLVAEAQAALAEGEARLAPVVEQARQVAHEQGGRVTPALEEARRVAREAGASLSPSLDEARAQAVRRAGELSEQLRVAVVEAEALARRAARVADGAAIAAAASQAGGRLRQSASSGVARAIRVGRSAAEGGTGGDARPAGGAAARFARRAGTAAAGNGVDASTGVEPAATLEAGTPVEAGAAARRAKAVATVQAARAAAAMRRTGRPGPLAVGFGLGAAQAAFAATFRGPRDRFWQRMTITGLALGSYAIIARPALRHTRIGPLHAALGAASAAVLYQTFRAGDEFARRHVPTGASDIAEIYALRELRPRGEIALRLVAVIGPAEELFWRGFVQEGLALRYGRWRGAALATAAYGGVHAVTGNFTLMGAAAVAGAHWSALYAAGVPLGALIVSHQIWDVWIFLVQPTGAARPA